jgi:photosystem II stability/assembly factor-like uncharacterized protein
MFMRSKMRYLMFLVGSICSLSVLAYEDPLSLPAEPSVLAARAALTAMARAGDRIVAVGQRGIVIHADSSKPTLQWHQASVPVSTDLTGVAFPTPREGWAVGHGAVVLRSADQGGTWQKLADGNTLGEAALAYYESSAANLSAERRGALLQQARRLAEEKETQPFLDVWFKDAKTGYVVGTFNRIFRTDDGGEHWTPLIDRTDNPEELHFYAVRGSGNELYLAGERGMVWRWDEARSAFIDVRTPYTGSLFGLIVTPQAVLAYGMRGSLYRSTDRGAHWQQIETGLRAGIVAGDLSAGGEIVVVAQSGDAIVSKDGGESFDPLPLARREMASAILEAENGSLVVVGPAGVREEFAGEGQPERSPR